MFSEIYLSFAIVGFLVILLGLLRLRRTSLQDFMLSIAGAIIGLLLGALVSIPISQLPPPYGQVLPILASIFLTVGFIILAFAQRRILIALFPFLQMSEQIASGAQPVRAAAAEILVDTSVIIDGRIADIAIAGFVPGRLLVPRFVLAELQNIADSEDAMRRGRGRRGLEVLNRLRETDGIEVEIIEQDAPEIKEVDHKLVALARLRPCDVLTTDYNLNRVAQIQGVRVLNINELANAIRPVVIPGEELVVHVVQPGKERGQGVGYLADGTMIVVDNGDKLMGQDVITEVTRVFQTVAGKMIFAVPKSQNGGGGNGNGGSPKGGRGKNQRPLHDAPVVEEVIAELVSDEESIATAPTKPKAETNEPKQQQHRNRGNGNHRRNGRNESPEDRLIRAAQEAATSLPTEP